jgi:hypothetical protein
VSVFVDDETLVARTVEAIQKMKVGIRSKFEITNMGEINYLLGWEIARNRETKMLQIGQQKYCHDPLQRFNMSKCAPVSTPMDRGHHLNTKDQVADGLTKALTSDVFK